MLQGTGAETHVNRQNTTNEEDCKHSAKIWRKNTKLLAEITLDVYLVTLEVNYTSKNLTTWEKNRPKYSFYLSIISIWLLFLEKHKV